MRVRILTHVEHNGTRHPGDVLTLPDQTARRLIERRLAEVIETAKLKATAESASALPVAPASPEATSRKSKRGAKQAPQDSLL